MDVDDKRCAAMDLGMDLDVDPVGTFDRLVTLVYKVGAVGAGIGAAIGLGAGFWIGMVVR